MATYGITSAGFLRKRLEDIRAEIRSGFEGVFGAALNTDADAAVSQFIDVFGGQLAEAWEGAEGVYHAFDPASAEGIPLENLAALFKVFRDDATPSTGTITVAGASGTVIPEGYEVRASGTDVNVVTTDPATIPVSGSVTIAARTVDTGPIVVEAGDIDTAVDSIAGVTSVTNSADFVQGQEVESDQDLAVKRDASLQTGGSAVDRAVRARLLELSFIDQALVISNRSDTVDANGFPGHSMNPVLWPPTADLDQRQQIVDVLVRHAPGGIRVNGSIEYTVTDDYGYTDPDPYGFSFASEQEVHVEAVVTTDANYPADGDAQVQAAIVEAGNNLSVGADVVLLTILCSVVASVPGLLTLELRAKVGSAPGPGDTSNITIALDEIARFATARTTVTS